MKRRREVVSDLIVYQSRIDNSAAAEYRNVRLVDGKEVARRDRRVEQLFGRLAKADSIKKELERIARESKRYDLNYSVYNHTLNQGLPLDERLRPSFRFTVIGGGSIDGHDVIEVGYEQVSQLPEQEVKLSLPERLKGAELLYRGRLWLDRESARLRREEREWALKHPSLPGPLTYMKFEFSYADSRFEILTPTRIIFSTFDRGRDLPGGGAELSLGGRVVFEYREFRRFGVDAPDSRLDAPGPVNQTVRGRPLGRRARAAFSDVASAGKGRQDCLNMTTRVRAGESPSLRLCIDSGTATSAGSPPTLP